MLSWIQCLQDQGTISFAAKSGRRGCASSMVGAAVLETVIALGVVLMTTLIAIDFTVVLIRYTRITQNFYDAFENKAIAFDSCYEAMWTLHSHLYLSLVDEGFEESEIALEIDRHTLFEQYDFFFAKIEVPLKCVTCYFFAGQRFQLKGKVMGERCDISSTTSEIPWEEGGELQG